MSEQNLEAAPPTNWLSSPKPASERKLSADLLSILWFLLVTEWFVVFQPSVGRPLSA
jgi:hypothetical protein